MRRVAAAATVLAIALGGAACDGSPAGDAPSDTDTGVADDATAWTDAADDDTGDDPSPVGDDVGIAGPDDVPTAADEETQPVVPNDDPVAGDDQVILGGGSTVSITALYNDYDPDGDLVRITEVTAPLHGTSEVTYGGTELRYTLTDFGYTGQDTFEYTLSDGRGGSDTATITVSISAGPVLMITSPEDGAVVTGGSVTIEFQSSGCNFGPPNQAPGGCHAHKWLDGGPWALADGSGHGQYQIQPFSVWPLSSGQHTFELVLVRNDGSDQPWQPYISDFVTFEVP